MPQALAALRRGDIDLAIVDVMLPEVDGFEVVRQARRNSSIPIILLTARGEEASRVAGLEVGADDYVVSRSWPTRWWPGSGLSSAGRAASTRTPRRCELQPGSSWTGEPGGAPSGAPGWS